ncbi:terminase gpA endonuclease subunit [Psittacicella hinzii]|nr:terminase gpA endonuclease subunit [Psittacicella hinzii]
MGKTKHLDEIDLEQLDVLTPFDQIELEEERAEKRLDKQAKEFLVAQPKKIDKSFNLNTYIPLTSLYDIFSAAIEVMKPPPREPVSATLSRILRIPDKSSSSKPFQIDGRVSYMREPVDLLNSRQYNGIIFMGCARSGKTQALVNGFASYAMYTSRDIMVVQMNGEKALEWAKKEFHPTVNSSPDLKCLLTGKDTDTNLQQIKTRQGSWVLIRAPTVSAAASTTVQYVVLTDSDRMQLDIDGEGSPWKLFYTRITTYGFDGMAVIESSPGYAVINSEQRLDPHDCHACPGIASEYLTGDKRCYYFQCMDCKEYFWATPNTIYWDQSLETIKDRAQSARVKCPHCKHLHTEHDRINSLIPNGVWLKQGETIDKNGVISGQALDSKFASFWLRAPACGFITLEEIVFRYLQAEEVLEKTGDENPLKVVVNTVFGDPFVSRRNQDAVAIVEAKEDTPSDFALGIAPENTVLCIACVDVQNGEKSHFVVQIFAVTQDKKIHVVDRYSIKDWRGERVDAGVRGSNQWEAIEHEVMNYQLQIDKHPEIYLKPHITLCDSGGEGATTENAYTFYKRQVAKGNGHKLFLVKGVSALSGKVAEYAIGRDARSKSYQRRVPLFKIIASYFKDVFLTRLQRPAEDELSISFNSGLPKSLFNELKAEERNEKGRYVKKAAHLHNEALDLCTYATAYIDFFQVPALLDKEVPPDWLKLAYKGNTNSYFTKNNTSAKANTTDETKEKSGKAQVKVIKAKRKTSFSLLKSRI